MAEAVLSIAVEKLTDLLIGEAGFLFAVKDDVESLKAELRRMQCFIKDADSKQDQDERVRNWVAEIRDLAYDAEDVIDAFLLKLPRAKLHICGLNPFSMFYKAFTLHQFGTRIKSILTRTAAISASVHTYDIKFVGEAESSGTSAREMQRRVRRTDPDDEDEDVISLENTTRALMDQLMQESERVCVVSIVGMGGLGKTTLAKKVYNHSAVKRHFDCRSWVFLSQQFSPRHILLRILKEFFPSEQRRDLEMTEEDEVVKSLKDVLKEKRYLVVLDDIWRKEAWDSLKSAFPKGKKGSKILFTTRIKEVAVYADSRSCPVEPPFLTNEQGWELLKKKALAEEHAGNLSYMAEFKVVGMEMVRKCRGLPLAIAVLGGLLGNKSLHEWEFVLRDINAQSIKLQHGSQYAGVDWILGLSYHDLPYRLKPCFLYLSLFPEDSEIRKRRLIRMWIAEGFIGQPSREEGDKTMEDVGEEYVEELVSRCMVQVSRWDHTGIGVKAFRMHDLMRDMCLLRASQESFLGVFDDQQSDAAGDVCSMRRIAVHCRGSDDNLFGRAKECGQRLRSLHYLTKSRINRHEANRIFRKCKMLRVLNFEHKGGDLNRVSGEIGKLILLRYFRWGTSWEGSLPASIGNLEGLCTLDLRYYGGKIHDVLWRLKNLRHLLLSFGHEGNYRLDTLINLETLEWVKAKNLVRKDGMLRLKNLRNLKLSFETEREIKVVLESPIFELGRLHSLHMRGYYAACFPDLEVVSGSNRLTKLVLDGIIREDTVSSHQSLRFLPKSLTKLCLNSSRLKHDPMGILGKLPCLRYLTLGNWAYEGSKMVCSANCFHQLEILTLTYLGKLEELEIEGGAMPCLKALRLDELTKLRRFPEGLMFITTLQELKLDHLTYGLLRRIRVIDGEEGEDVYKVRHIPSISLGRSFDPTKHY